MRPRAGLGIRLETVDLSTGQRLRGALHNLGRGWPARPTRGLPATLPWLRCRLSHLIGASSLESSRVRRAAGYHSGGRRRTPGQSTRSRFRSCPGSKSAVPWPVPIRPRQARLAAPVSGPGLGRAARHSAGWLTPPPFVTPDGAQRRAGVTRENAPRKTDSAFDQFEPGHDPDFTSLRTPSQLWRSTVSGQLAAMVDELRSPSKLRHREVNTHSRSSLTATDVSMQDSFAELYLQRSTHESTLAKSDLLQRSLRSAQQETLLVSKRPVPSFFLLPWSRCHVLSLALFISTFTTTVP